MRYIFDTEDEQEAIDVIKSRSLKIALWEFDQWLRSQIKYGEKEEKDLTEIRQKLHEFLNENGVSIE